jgi:hypothetical protein
LSAGRECAATLASAVAEAEPLLAKDDSASLHELIGRAHVARADDRTLELDLRYAASRSQPNALQQTLVYREPVRDWFELTAGIRLSESSRLVDGMTYAGQAVLAPLPFTRFGLRVVQVNRLVDGAAATILLGTFELRANLLDVFGAWAAIGYYKLFSQLANPVPVPTFTNIAFADADLAASLGLWLRVTPSWLVRSGIGSFEVIDVYNLNHPFTEARLEYFHLDPDWVGHVFARYQLALGFGRQENFTLGVGATFRL